jgi:hypothetical protein
VSRDTFGGIRAVGRMREEIGDIAARLGLYGEYLPKQARWQAELLMFELETNASVERAETAFQAMADSIGRIDAVVAAAPDIVAREREALVDDLSRERVDTIRLLIDERLDTMRELDEDIEHVLAAMRAEREIVLQALDEERVAALADVRVEREALTADGERIGALLVDRALDRAGELLDRALLIVAVLAGIAFAIPLWLAVLRRPPRPT